MKPSERIVEIAEEEGISVELATAYYLDEQEEYILDEQKWISLDDRLPDEWQEVVIIAKAKYRNNWFENLGTSMDNEIQEVTQWRYI